jgi:hypothetical protein
LIVKLKYFTVKLKIGGAMNASLEKVKEIPEVKKGIGKKTDRPYVTIRIDDSITETLVKTGWNVNGIFTYGFYILSGEVPPTLKMLCEKFNIDIQIAREKYLEILKEAIKRGRMIYEKTLSSTVVYLIGKGKISKDEIARAGGATPPSIYSTIKELELE